MGLQTKIGTGIETQAQQPCQRGPCGFGGVGWDHLAWARVRTTWLLGAPFCHVA